MATRLTELLKEAMAKGQTEEGQPALGEGSQGGWDAEARHDRPRA